MNHSIASVELVGSTIPELAAKGFEWWVGTCACGWHTSRFWYKEQAQFYLAHHISGHAGAETHKRRKAPASLVSTQQSNSAATAQ